MVAAENSCLASTAVIAVSEMGCIVKVFDIGAIDTEQIFDARRREMVDDVVNHPLFPGHSLTCLLKL